MYRPAVIMELANSFSKTFFLQHISNPTESDILTNAIITFFLVLTSHFKGQFVG